MTERYSRAGILNRARSDQVNAENGRRKIERARRTSLPSTIRSPLASRLLATYKMEQDVKTGLLSLTDTESADLTNRRAALSY